MIKRVLLLAGVFALWLGAPGAKAQILFTASMDSSQETPPTKSPAQATAWVLLSADMSTLTYQVTYAHLDTTFTAAHFHIGAPGVAGGVVHPISFTGNTSSGSWTQLPDSVVRQLLRGNLYLNIHTVRYPGGAIRGQLKPAPGMGFSISMSGAQETPPTQTGGAGTGFAYFNPDSANMLFFRVTFAGLSDSAIASHFHIAPVGVAGNVIHPVPLTDSTVAGSWTFPDSVYALAIKGLLYYNVHTKKYPGGEIRGQLVSATGQRFTIKMDGAQETPPNTSRAKGSGWAILSPDGASLSFRITYAQLESTYTASHFHTGAPGVGGPVVHPFNFTGNTATGTWTQLQDSILGRLLQGNVYANIHTAKRPGGEIRGQLFPEGAPVFTISADAAQETPPTTSKGKGSGFAVLDSSALLISFQVTIAGMGDTVTAAHFHSAPIGVPGPVIHPVSFVDSTTSGNWTGFPDSVVERMVRGGLYFNAHTKPFPGGAIRGQLLYAQTPVTSVQEIPGAVPASFSLAQNYPNPFNPTTAIQFSLNSATHVTLRVYNLLGQEVATLVDEVRPAGVYRATFDAHALSSGVYFYRLTTGAGQAEARKMVLVK
ncbi:MAG TPA: CHRD domain-containing protein [Desulfuromonadaceae bacterium]